MSQLFKRLVLVCIVAVAIVLLAGASLIGWYAFEQYRFVQTTPLAAGLSGKWDDMRQRLRARAQARFPVGTPVAEMRDALLQQNFAPSTASGGHVASQDEERGLLNGMSAETKMAVADAGSIVCNTRYIIGWQADQTARVSRVLADIATTCL